MHVQIWHVVCHEEVQHLESIPKQSDIPYTFLYGPSHQRLLSCYLKIPVHSQK